MYVHTATVEQDGVYVLACFHLCMYVYDRNETGQRASVDRQQSEPAASSELTG